MTAKQRGGRCPHRGLRTVSICELSMNKKLGLYEPLGGHSSTSMGLVDSRRGSEQKRSIDTK